MGNTTSTSSSKLRRNSTTISPPRALHSPFHHHHLGPENIISPYPVPHSSPINNTHYSPETTRTLRSKESRSSNDHGSSSNANIDESVIRRSKSANAAVQSRPRDGQLGAPPPYTREDASHSNLVLVDTITPTNDGFLEVPIATGWTPSHRRAVSASSVQSSSSFHSSYQTSSAGHSRSASTESGIGYGVGVGYLVGYGYKYDGDGDNFDNEPNLNVDVVGRTSRPTRLTASGSDSRSMSTPSAEPTEPNVGPTSPSTPVAVEEPLDLLRRYDTIFLVDDSVSMAGERWIETREALASLAEKAAMYDADGVDILFINSSKSFKNMRSAPTVRRLFSSVEPQGCSFLALKLEELLKDYLAELENSRSQTYGWKVKPINYIIITDGAPTDDPEPVIAHAARTLDKGNFPQGQIGIQFVQVGDDPRATEVLQQLDDDIARTYGTRDIVDFTPYHGGPLTSDLLLKILLGGIHKRIDRRGIS